MFNDGRARPSERERTRRDDGHWSLRGAIVTVVLGYVLLAAVLIGLGAAIVHLIAPIRHWDDHVNASFASHRTAVLDSVSRGGTFIANTLGVLVVAAAVTVLGLVRRWGRAAALLVAGLGLEIAVFLTVNYIVARPRPSAPHVGPTPSTYSFPSGHVAATLVLYGGIAVLVGLRTHHLAARVVAWLVAVAAVLWVGFSRVYEAQHHPTDVFAGLLMGIAALSVVLIALRPERAAPPEAPISGPVAHRLPAVSQVAR